MALHDQDNAYGDKFTQQVVHQKHQLECKVEKLDF